MRHSRGFSAIEYAFLIAIVVAGLIGMSVYTKRAIMGKWREAADTFGFGRQYDPGVTQVIGLSEQLPTEPQPLPEPPPELIAPEPLPSEPPEILPEE